MFRKRLNGKHQLIIRKETKLDVEAISNITKLAFENHPFSKNTEQFIINALRAAIREEIRSERWEAALTLVDGIEQRFGYKQEADALREELDEARNAAIQSKLSEAIQLIETHFEAHEWDRAQSEIDRVLNTVFTLSST